MTQRSNLPSKPMAQSPETNSRWEATAQRVRLLTGNWRPDLEQELLRHFDSARRAAIGIADMSSNVFKAICEALSALYAEAPAIGVTGDTGRSAAPLLDKGGFLDKAGWFSLMQTVQIFTIGCREMVIRVGVNPHQQGLLFRPITPDYIYATAPGDDPENPNYLYELILRQNKETKKFEWTADVFDLRGDIPKFYIMTVGQDGEFLENVTRQYTGSEDLSGENYPYIDRNGEAFIPYVIYHARNSGNLWMPYELAEVCRGSLSTSALYTYYLHLLRDVAHPQRYLAGFQLAGLSAYDTDSSGARQAISTDPASILCFSADPDSSAQGMIGQFASGGDPMTFLEAICTYERRLAVYAGVSPADIVKASGDPRSGFAISLQHSQKRQYQRQFSPVFRFGDIRTLELAAKIANSAFGLSMPESGYIVEYSSVPLSPEALKAQREDILSKINAGLMSKVDAIQVLYPDFTRQEAINYLLQIENDQKQF